MRVCGAYVYALLCLSEEEVIEAVVGVERVGADEVQRRNEEPARDQDATAQGIKADTHTHTRTNN